MTTTAAPGWVWDPYYGGPRPTTIPWERPTGRPMVKPDAIPLRGPAPKPISLGPYINPIIGTALVVLMSNTAERLEEIYLEGSPIWDDIERRVRSFGLVQWDLDDWAELGEASNELWDVFTGLLPTDTEIAQHLMEHPPIPGETAETTPPSPDGIDPTRLLPFVSGMVAPGALTIEDRFSIIGGHRAEYVWQPTPPPVEISITNPAITSSWRFTQEDGYGEISTDIPAPDAQPAPYSPDRPDYGTAPQSLGDRWQAIDHHLSQAGPSPWHERQVAYFTRYPFLNLPEGRKPFSQTGAAVQEALERLTAPAVEPLPLAQVITQRTQTGNFGLSMRVSRTANPTYAAETTLSRDQKWASQLYYMMILKLVNRTWGTVSEVIDMMEVIFRSITVDGKKINWTDPDSIERLLHGDIEVDMEALVIGALQEQTMDMLIGMMSQAEKRLMLRLFGPSHWVNNLFGMPSTWIRRLSP